jgi:hypothetical protein
MYPCGLPQGINKFKKNNNLNTMKWNPFSGEFFRPTPEDEISKKSGSDNDEPEKNHPKDSNQEKPREEINDEVKELLEKEENIDCILDSPEVRSYMSIVYELPEPTGRELPSGHKMGFVIPEAFRKRLIRDVILRHRKDSKYAVDIGEDRHDPHGAYSRVEMHNPQSRDWVKWKDPKGYNPDKFAEPRPASDPENEVLHDWLATVGEVQADAVRLTNVGQHPKYSTSQIHGLEIVFHPETSHVQYNEKIYCQGTAFIDIPDGKKLPTYGGGSHTEGKYIGAIPLNQFRPVLYELGHDTGKEARLENGKLIVKLDAEQSLVEVEISVGDTEHLTEINPKTGRHTRLGYAKLWVGIKRKETDQVDWFMENVNIPPQGVLAGGPSLKNSKIQPGDELVIEARADTAYLMGYRLTYSKGLSQNAISPAI